jgi:RimJ/RimL family protein N-acetyltransferase
MTQPYPHFAFERLAETDLPMLCEWLGRIHVAEWWGAAQSLEQVRAEFLPLLERQSTVIPYFGCWEGVPVGYIQSYEAVESGDGWWVGQHDGSVRGIDQFLANAAQLGQGLGTQMIREFVQFLFRDPAISKIQSDPTPANLRAIRCYEKVGFRRVGEILTPDGPAMLMAIERTSWERG